MPRFEIFWARRPLSNDLAEDTIEYILNNEKKKIYNLEDYIELLIFCNKTNKIKTLLENFNIKKCDLTNNNEENNFSVDLEKIKSNQKIFTQYCFESEEENICKKKF